MAQTVGRGEAVVRSGKTSEYILEVKPMDWWTYGWGAYGEARVKSLCGA